MSTSTTEAADRAELAALEHAQYGGETIDEFVARVTPQYARIPSHLRAVYDLIELSRYQEVYATISMPPRHGKTESIGTGIAYRIDQDPACRNVYATYGSRLSQRTSRKVRRRARAAGVRLSDEVANVDEWETPYGGGLKATSIDGDVTGYGVNGGLIVGDDLLKGRKKAENKQVRDDAWNWLVDDLLSRAEPGASVIINATRWHEDDPIGRLYANGMGLPWIHIRLPAIRDVHGNAADERLLGYEHVRALWPEGGFGFERLAKIRLRSEHGWWSLYQQQPYARGGGDFKLAWLADKIIDVAPAGRQIRSWDLAASTDPDASWTAGARMSLTQGRTYVHGMRRGQWEPGDRDAVILATAQADGHGVEIWLPQDPAQAGKSQKIHFARLLAGYNVRFLPQTGSKALRFDGFSAQAQAGNVYLVRGEYLPPLLAELEALWTGKADDQADALGMGYTALISKPERRVGVAPIPLTRQQPAT